jgi:putative PEP-CTERM system TPR-repeat lipoprotein
MVLAALASGDISKAQAALQKLRDKEGDNEMVANLSGLIKLAQVDLAGARATFEAVLKANPKSVPARLNLAKVAVLQGQPAEAEKLLGDVLDIDPTNDTALTALLTHLLNTNRVARAIDVVQKARAVAPDNALLTATLADLETRNGEPEKAIALLDRAPKDQIGLPALLGARARALVTMNNLSDARDTYTRILTQNPNDLDARGHLTDVQVALKDYVGARTTVQDGLKLAPKNYAMLRALTQIEQRASGLPAALDLADKLEKDPANLPQARLLKGDVYLAARQPDKAADAFAAEFKAAPATDLVLRLAAVQESLGRSDQAIQTLTDWIARNPDDTAAIEAVAYDELAAQKNDLAQAHLEALLATRPGNPMAMNNLAWIYGLKNDPRALPLARKAYALRPVAEIADTLGWLMVRDGESDSALPLLREASDVMPNNPAVQFHYALGLKQTGHRDEAVRLLSTALATTASFPERTEAQDLLKELNAPK